MSEAKKLWWFEAWWQVLVILFAIVFVTILLIYNPVG